MVRSPHNRAALLLTFALWLLPGGAGAQLPLPGLGGGGDEPAVRLADPREQLAAVARAIEVRRQAVMLRQGDLDRWRARRAAIGAQLSALDARRATLVTAAAPDEQARTWVQTRAVEPPEVIPAPTAPDAEVPADPADGGVDGDAEGLDAGVSADGSAADAAADAGVDATVDAEIDAAVDAASAPTAGLMPLLETEGGWLVPGVHPAEIVELDATGRALRNLDGVLAALVRLNDEESAQLAAALAQIERMQRALTDKPVAPGLEQPGLRDVERLALDVHKAGIELALARARQRRSAMDDADAAETVKRRRGALVDLEPLDDGDLEPWPAFAESFSRAERQRERVEEIRRETFAAIDPLGQLTESVARARVERHDTAARAAQQALDDVRTTYEAALARMAITAKDEEWANRKYERSTELRAKNIPALEAQLDGLRVVGNSTVQARVGPFDTVRLRQLERTVIGEKLGFERLKLERDTFRYDLMRAIKAMSAGEPPDPAFTEQHGAIIDPGRLQSQIADRETRCEGWRRAHADVRKADPPPSLADNVESIDEQFRALDDLCGRLDMVQATMGRLGDIGHFHLERFAEQGRSVWWYTGRVALSLLVLMILLGLSRLASAITRRLAGHGREDGSPTATRTLGGLARLRSIGALALYLGSLGVLWLGAGVLAANAILELDLDIDGLLEFATQPVFFVGDAEVSLWSMARLMGWVVLALWAGRLVQRFSTDLMEHFAVESALRDTFGTLVRYLTVAVGIAIGMASAGIGFGALAVFFGVIGIGVGLGLQTIANNFISGFILLIERPVRKGDFVQVGDMVGEVRAIRARATTIETRDGVTVIVPNSEFVTDRVVNWTLGRGERVRGKIEVGVAYGADVERAREILAEAATAHPKVLDAPPPEARLVEFGDSSLDLVLYFWSRDIRGLPRLTSDLNRAIEAALTEAGIEIPFPQTDLNVRSLPPPTE